jgi:hypothetical protein
MRVAVLVSVDLAWAAELAARWHVDGDEVTLVLLDRTAAAARRGHQDAEAVGDAVKAGVVVWAHSDALRRRAIDADHRIDGLKVCSLDEVADLITEGAEKVLWL